MKVKPGQVAREARRGPRAWAIRNTQAGVAAIANSRSVVNKASGDASR